MKAILAILVLGLLTAVSAQAQVRIGECVPKSEMQQIAKHFTQFRNIANSDYCYDGSQTANLIKAMMFMRQTAFDSNMKKSSDELFSGRFASSWYDYFIGRITDISVQKSCPKGVGAYVYGFGSTMYVCPMMLTDTFSGLDRASVFMHEARHIDGYPHTTCRQGARAGLSGACDTRISDGGSYAVTVETYAQFAKYATDAHPALKAYAMNAGVTYADEAFEVPVKVQRQEQLLLMGENQKFYGLDLAKNKIETLGDVPALGKIVPRALHMILFPEDKTQIARYVFAKNEGEIEQSAGDIALDYNTQTPAQRGQLKDVHIAAQWAAKVYADKIEFTCNPNAATTETMKIEKGQATSLLYLNGYNRAAKSTFLLLDSGAILEIGCSNNRAVVKDSNQALPGRFVRVHKANNRIFALSEQGELFDITSGQANVIETGLNVRIHEIAPKQSFSFLDAR